MTKPFPSLTLADWQDTRDTMQKYAQIVGKVRRTLAPPQKHWWHICLKTCAVGLTTTPIAYDNFVFETTVIPLPAALPLFGSALAALGLIGWRRRSS